MFRCIPQWRIYVVGQADATAPTLLDINIFNLQNRFYYMLQSDG